VGCLVVALLPVVDLVLLWQIGQRVGFLPLAGALLVTGLLGFWIARSQGMSALRGVQQSFVERRSPEVPVVAAFLAFAGGILLALPGPISGIAGVVLLFPPSRKWVARLLRRRWENAIASGRMTILASGGFGAWGSWTWQSGPRPGVVDVEASSRELGAEPGGVGPRLGSSEREGTGRE
jgi:UPF0716 protein FxsA